MGLIDWSHQFNLLKMSSHSLYPFLDFLSFDVSALFILFIWHWIQKKEKGNKEKILPCPDIDYYSDCSVGQLILKVDIFQEVNTKQFLI